MLDVTIAHAKEHLEDLIGRAAQGEEVRIIHPTFGVVRLQAAAEPAPVPLGKRMPGRLKGKMVVPARLMEPMMEVELRDWYGDNRHRLRECE